MYRWYGDSGFYKTALLKTVIVGMSGCSLAHRLLLPNQPPPILCIQWLLVGAVKLWACPSAGVWLVAVLVLLSCRPLERRLGSAKLAAFLFSSFLVGMSLTLIAVVGASLSHLPLPHLLSTGTMLHMLVGSLALCYHRTVFPLHSSLSFGLALSSNLVFYLLVALFSCISSNTALLTGLGMLGAALMYWLGPLPLPSPPGWLSTALSSALEVEPSPPVLLSGATLGVQRQQQADRWEQMMLSMYQQRQLVVGHPHLLQRRPPPPEDRIARLVAMGFHRSDAQQALVATGNDIQRAVQLLANRPNHNI